MAQNFTVMVNNTRRFTWALSRRPTPIRTSRAMGTVLEEVGVEDEQANSRQSRVFRVK